MQQIKSRDRVRDHGEVFTAPREVNAMLDLLPPELFANPDSTFLEPTCGTGNFLVEVLRRKLTACPSSPVVTLRVVCSLYGLDLADDNIATCHERLSELVHEHVKRLGLAPADARQLLSDCAHVMAANVKAADTLRCDVHGTRWEWRQVAARWVCVPQDAVLWRAADGRTAAAQPALF